MTNSSQFRIDLFQHVAAVPLFQRKPKAPSPLSIRLSGEEKADLQARAGDSPVSAYAKSLLFAEGVKGRRLSPRNPLLDHQILAQILGQFGRSEIAPDLAVLADAVRSGSLPMDEVTVSQIEQSVADIARIRALLMEGLGKRV